MSEGGGGGSGAERRKYRRVHAPVICRLAGSKALATHDEAIDVSRGGVRIYCDEPASVGNQLTLELSRATGSATATVRAQVAWVERLPKGALARFDVGLKFIEPDAKTTAFLDGVLGD